MKGLALSLALVLSPLSLTVHARTVRCRAKCSCGWEHDPIKAREGFDLVIEGRVLDSALSVPVSRTTYLYPLSQVRVVVRAVWKGNPTDTIYVLTSDPSGCGFGFVGGEAYLLFLYRDPAGELFATRCSLSQPRADADSVIAALGPPLR
jgi:hypothetical protein